MKCVDAGLYAAALQLAGRQLMGGQAGNEGLKTLQAFVMQALQLVQGLGVIVYTQVQIRVILVALDAQRRRLLAALVATGRLTRLHGADQAQRQRLPGTGGKGLGSGFDHARPGQHVASHTDIVLQQVAAPADTCAAGVGSTRAPGWQHMQLALGLAGVGADKRAHHRRSREALRQKRQPLRAIQRVHQGLGCNCSRPGPGVDAQ